MCNHNTPFLEPRLPNGTKYSYLSPSIPLHKEVDVVARSDDLHLGLFVRESVCVGLVDTDDAIPGTQATSVGHTLRLNLETGRQFMVEQLGF